MENATAYSDMPTRLAEETRGLPDGRDLLNFALPFLGGLVTLAGFLQFCRRRRKSSRSVGCQCGPVVMLQGHDDLNAQRQIVPQTVVDTPTAETPTADLGVSPVPIVANTSMGAFLVDLEAPCQPDMLEDGFGEDLLTPVPEDWAKVQNLRQALEAERDAGLFLGYERWLEDGELLRFARARRTTDEAATLFRDAVAWRQKRAMGATGLDKWPVQAGSFGGEHKLYMGSSGGGDSVSSSTRSGSKTRVPDWWAFLNDHLFLKMYGCDRYGLPIVYNALGHCDLQGCTREVGFDALQRFAIMQNDYFLDVARDVSIRRSSNAQNAHPSVVLHGGIVIVDLEGLSWRHIGEVKVFNEITTAVKILHPERQRRCFVIRAPRAFAAVWRLVKPLIDPRTTAKITILGSRDSLQPLIDELGPDNVPDFLGGRYNGLPAPTDGIVPHGAFQQFLNRDRW